MMSFHQQLANGAGHNQNLKNPGNGTNNNTQTNRETRSRKFSFPRNSSFTNESISEATDNTGMNVHGAYGGAGQNIAYSQFDARSHAGTDDNVFDPASSQGHNGAFGQADSRLWRRLDTDKVIQYEELASKGSERPASMFGPTNQEGHRGGGTAQGVGTNNSIMVSGTPTDASNYYNQQTFFQINYIGNGNSANRHNGLAAGAAIQQNQGYSLNKFRNQRNRGSSNSRYQPTQFLNNANGGGLSSLSQNQGYQYPNSAGGFYNEGTLSSALQRSNSKSSLQALVQDLDFGQYLNHSSYLQGQALLSPRHIRAAVLKYDRHFHSRDLRWSDFSILQKLLYLFENQRNLDPRELIPRGSQRSKTNGGAGTSMRIETNGVISEHSNTIGNRASTSLNHRTSRLANASYLDGNIAAASAHNPNNETSNFKPNASGRTQKEMLQNMIGSIEIKEIKQFIENFRQEDQLEKHQKAQELLIEDQRAQIFQKNQRIEFLEKKIELLEEQSTKMKDRLHQNIEQYEHEIKIKDEINSRERENLMEQICSQMEELDKSKKEATMKEQQLQDHIDHLERLTNFNANESLASVANKTGRSMTQVGTSKSGGAVAHDLGLAIRNLNQRKNKERFLNTSYVQQQQRMDDQQNVLNMSTDFYHKVPQLVDSVIENHDFNSQMNQYQDDTSFVTGVNALNSSQLYEPQILQQHQIGNGQPHHRQSSTNTNMGQMRKGTKSIRESFNGQGNNAAQQHKSSGKSVGAQGGNNGNIVLRSDQIRRIYTNGMNGGQQRQITYFSPASGPNGVRKSQNNSLSANAKVNINNSVVSELASSYHPFEQTQPYHQPQFQGASQYNQIIPSYLSQKQQLLNAQIAMTGQDQNIIQPNSYQTSGVDQLATTQQFTNRAVSQNYQSGVALQNSNANAGNDSVPNSGRSKTPNDHMSIKTQRGGELARQLRMATHQNVFPNQQRRLYNGSVDFNQTDTLTNRYVRDLQATSITRIAGGSVSPSHHYNGEGMLVDGFVTERTFDNLNQTVQLTLGKNGQLLSQPVNYSVSGSRSQIKRTLADHAKKRDIIARSSIESHRQFGSPIPNDRARIMPSQIERMSQNYDKNQLKALRASQNAGLQESLNQIQHQTAGASSRGQKLKFKVQKNQIKREQMVDKQVNDSARLVSIQSSDNYNIQAQQQVPISIPVQNFQIRPATAGSKAKILNIKNQQIQQNHVVATRASQESLQQVYESQNGIMPGYQQANQPEQKAFKVMDSSRVKLKPARQAMGEGAQTVLGKNLKISPYQINWNPSTKQVIPASKQQASQSALRQSHMVQHSTKQLQQQMSIPQTNYADQMVYQTNIENPQMTQSPIIGPPQSKIVGNFKHRPFGKALLSDRNIQSKNAPSSNILVHDAQVNNWFTTDGGDGNTLM